MWDVAHSVIMFKCVIHLNVLGADTHLAAERGAYLAPKTRHWLLIVVTGVS